MGATGVPSQGYRIEDFRAGLAKAVPMAWLFLCPRVGVKDGSVERGTRERRRMDMW